MSLSSPARTAGVRRVGSPIVEQRVLGRTNRPVSVIGLGTWQLGADWGDVSERDALDVLQAAVETGVTFLDTADVYGDGRSEKIIGRFIAGNAGQHLTVATKMGRRVDLVPENYTLDNFRAWTDRSRVNLGVETLDLVQLHCPPTAVFASDEVFDALDTLVSEERIAAYGVSVETAGQALTAIARAGTAGGEILLNPVRAKAAGPGAARGGRGRGGHHRPGATGLGPAVRPVHPGHPVRRRRPPALQPAPRSVRPRRDVLRRGLRGRGGSGPGVRRAGAGRSDPGPDRAALDHPAGRGDRGHPRGPPRGAGPAELG